ncbi:ATP-dependent DNA helicase PIF1 [Glycine soja]
MHANESVFIYMCQNKIVVLLSRHGSFWFAFVVQAWNCDFVLLFCLLSLSRVLKDRSFSGTFVLLRYPAMSRKENLISELHMRKGTWKIVVRITDLWEVRKQNSKQAIEMVLMDQTGTKIGATLWQELFAKFRHKLHCDSSIVDNQSEYRVSPVPHLVYFVRTTSVKEIQRLEIPPNVYMSTPFADIISGVAPCHTLMDIVGVVTDLIGVKIVNPPHRMTLHDAIDKNLLLQEPLIVMLSLGKIKDATDKYPLSVRNIKYGSRLYVNTDIAKIQQFCNSLCVPFYSGGITDNKGGSQSQSSQSNLVEKFLHNAQVVSIGSACRSCQNRVNNTVPSIMGTKETSFSGMQHVSRCLVGDDIKVFPPCVDEILSKTWAIRFKYRSQLRQSSVLDVSEEPHHIQTLTTTLGLKGEASMGKAIAVEPERSPLIYHPTMVSNNSFIVLPTPKSNSARTMSSVISTAFTVVTYHRHWGLTYPLYVTFDYNEEKHFIKVRRDGNKFYFADGLKDFRRVLGIHEGLVVHFAAPDRNTSFYLHFMPPLDRQTSGRPYSTTRTYVFIVDITNHIISTPTPLVLPPDAVDIIGYRSQYLTVEPPRGRQIWWMSIQDGLQTLTTPWYQFLKDNNLMARDEKSNFKWTTILDKESIGKLFCNKKDNVQSLMYTSQCSPTFNDYNPTTSSQSTPLTNITLSMNRCRHHSTDHTINVLLIQRNLIYIYDAIMSVYADKNHTPSNTTQEDQFVIHDLSDCTDDDVNMTQENMDIDYSFNDPTIDDLDDYDGQSILATSSEYQNTVPNLKLKLISQRQIDGRLYNLPTTTERIHELHPAYLPLQYPLLYPKGEDAYREDTPHKDHANIHTTKRKKVTLREYFCYRLQSRTNEAQTILHSRRLFQQWIVDGYCMIESKKINYVRQNQQQLRVDKYINLITSNDHPETLGRDKGKRIILPSSFVGGERYMEQLYFDGMTICGHLGFPDLFLTLKCNPTWLEVQCKVTQSNLTPHNCPDIITQLTEKETIHLCLTKIENMLQANRKSLRDFPSMPYPIGYAPNQHHNKLIHNEMAYDKQILAAEFNRSYHLLIDEQKSIIDTIIRVVDTQSAGVYFLYGYDGTGKTFIWTTLSFAIRSNGGIVCTVASSGIASVLFPSGRTTHSKFSIPVPATQNSTCNIHQSSDLAKLLKVTKLIVWDEAPIMNMSPSDSPWPFKLIRRQFPFIVSYAMTINKSQGQSLEHVGLYLPHRVFSHGQLYVALSRVKSKKRLHILIHDNQEPSGSPLSFHRQWMYRYPKHVLFHYDGNKHFIRVRTYGSKCLFADGLKEFRRAHDLNESVILHFVAFHKNTTFSIDVIGPIHRQVRVKPVISTKRHIFTTDVTKEMIQHRLPLSVHTVSSSSSFEICLWFQKIYYPSAGTGKTHPVARHHPVEAKLHDESRLIQRCFDDNKDDDKGDDKKLKGQSKNEFKMFKIESRTLKD